MAQRRVELQVARIRKGLGVGEAAQLVEVSANAWRRWENGTRTPTLDKAIRVSEVLEVPVTTLFSDSESHGAVS